MLQERLCEYKKAYVELLELLKYLTPEQKRKIPSSLIEELEQNKDIEYIFIYDFSKTLLEQDFMSETKALLLQLYIKYLSNENEQEFWNTYKILCLKKINDNKEKFYNSQTLFNNNKNESSIKENPNELSIIIKKEKLYTRMFNFIKNIFNFGGNNAR